MAKQQGLTEEMVAHLETYEEGPFSDREKAALRLAECLALTPHQMDETFYDTLCEHFTPAQIVHLGVTIAFLYGFGRFVAAFRIPLKEEPGLAGMMAVVAM